MDFLDPTTKCFANYHPIPEKIIIIKVIAITEMIITQTEKQNPVA